MLWSFLAFFFSGWLYVNAAYRGPQWQRWVFKPLTLLLLSVLALQAPVFSMFGWLIVAGLFASLVGDALLLLSAERILYAIGAFFLSCLLYTASFAGTIDFTPHWIVIICLLIVAVLLLTLIWTRLDALKWPITTFVAMLILMAWMGFEHYLSISGNNSTTLMIATTLLFIAHTLWLISLFRHRFPADRAITVACYFIGHFMMVRTLYF
ncbi:lysoplasmalogenase [Enterobacteriaceae bacterium LUAb1]